MMQKLASSARYSIFWNINNGDSPCLCCDPAFCVNNDIWSCESQSRQWYIVGDDQETWGDAVLCEEQQKIAAEDENQRSLRLKQQAADEEQRLLNEESIRRSTYTRDVEFKTKLGLRKGQQVAKRQQPCKWVIGEFCGDECWAWEYTDPKTKNRVTPRKCDRLHPGEEGWCNEWFKNPRFKPAGEQRNFGALKANR